MWALTLQVHTRASDKLWAGQLQCWTGAQTQQGELGFQVGTGCSTGLKPRREPHTDSSALFFCSLAPLALHIYMELRSEAKRNLTLI